MARKLLLDERDKKYASSSCYLCYVCPKECYLSAPPAPSSLPQPQPPDSKNHPMTIILILMLSVLGAAFLFLSYLTVTKYRSRRTRSYPETALHTTSFGDENQGPVLDHPVWYIRTVGLPRSTIDSIAIVKYSKSLGTIVKNDCSVCLSEFQENEPLRLLPKCSHAFHVPCIDTWLSSHKNCPVCRAPILIDAAAAASNADSGLVGPGATEEDQAADELVTDEAGAENDILTCKLDSRDRKCSGLSDLGDRRGRLNLDSVRRSVSVDFSSASTVCGTEKDDVGCSDVKMGGKWEESEEPVSNHRSFSFSGKRSTRKSSRSMEGV